MSPSADRLVEFVTVIREGSISRAARVLDVPRASLRHRPGMGVRLELLPEQRVLLQRALLLREPMRVPPDVRRR